MKKADYAIMSLEELKTYFKSKKDLFNLLKVY